RNRAGSRAHRAHLDVALDTDLARYAQHVGGGLRVEAIEAHPGGEVLADDSHEMDHARAALDGCGQGIGLEHVTRDAIDGFEAATRSPAARGNARGSRARGAHAPRHGPRSPWLLSRKCAA